MARYQIEVNRFQDIATPIISSEVGENSLLSYSDEELSRIVVNSPILAPTVYALSPKLVAMKKNVVPEGLDDAVRAMEIAHALGIRAPSTRPTIQIDSGTYWIMDFIEGVALEEAWSRLSWFRTIRLAFQLRAYTATKEIMKYLKIAELGTDLRTSRLYGIVQDDNDPLIGLLYYNIDEESTLTWAVGPETPASLKERWSAQITHTLKTLHGAGVIWEDVRAANVLIDKGNNAWIIDFGGGYTEGWVDREKAGTVEGDLQGLANIMDFISEGESRTREFS